MKDTYYPPKKGEDYFHCHECRKNRASKGKMTLIHKLLNKRFGRLPPGLEKKLENSDSEMLDRFGENILDFRDLKDAENGWETHGKEGNA